MHSEKYPTWLAKGEGMNGAAKSKPVFEPGSFIIGAKTAILGIWLSRQLAVWGDFWVRKIAQKDTHMRDIKVVAAFVFHSYHVANGSDHLPKLIF